MGELGALFNPGMRHELEERRSKAMSREEEGNARDGDPHIDLESGVAVISSSSSEVPTQARPAASEKESAPTAKPAGPRPVSKIRRTPRPA